MMFFDGWKKYKWKRHDDGKTKKIDHSGYNVPNLKGYSGWNCDSLLGELERRTFSPLQLRWNLLTWKQGLVQKCDTVEMLALTRWP